MTRLPECVGRKDAAELFGVKSPNLMVSVPGLPRPRQTSGGPVWNKAEIVRMAKELAPERSDEIDALAESMNSDDGA